MASQAEKLRAVQRQMTLSYPDFNVVVSLREGGGFNFEFTVGGRVTRGIIPVAIKDPKNFVSSLSDAIEEAKERAEEFAKS